MAVENYSPITFTEGQCVDATDIQDLLDNLKALSRFAEKTGNSVSCERISATITELTDDGVGGCFTVREKTLPQPDEQIEKKIALLTISSDGVGYLTSGSNDYSEVTATLNISILCDGVSVWQGLAVDALFASFDCLPSSKIEICIQTDLTIISATVLRRERIHTICGGMLCVEQFDADSSLPTFFCPPCALESYAKPGREALHLVYQNTLALCSYFQKGNQTLSCNSYNFTDRLTHSLITSVSGQTTYFIIGEVRLCARIRNSGLTTTPTSTITINPVVGCEGEANACSTGKDITLAAEYDPQYPTADCVTVPVIVCGTCEPGQTLSVGFITSEECLGVPQPFASGNGHIQITSIEQDFCVYSWEEVEVPELSTFQQPNADCFNVKTLTDLADKQDLIEGLVCNREPLNCVLDQDNSKDIPRGETLTIKSAETAPVPLPDNWPGQRKLTLQLTFKFYGDYGGAGSNNNEPDYYSGGRIEILCGGTIIKTIDNNGGDYRWLTQRSSTAVECSPTYDRLCCNLICDVDQDLIIRPVIDVSFIAAGIVKWGTEITCTQIGF